MLISALLLFEISNMRLSCLLVLMAIVFATDAYKYLVVNPLFGHSHSNFIGQLADLLTEAGHEVHVFLPVYDPDLKSKPGVKITKKIEFLDGDADALKMMDDMKNGIFKNLWLTPADPISMYKMFTNMTITWTKSCSIMCENRDLHARFKAEKYDAALVEPMMLCFSALLNHLGIPTVGALSTYHLDAVALAMGEPFAPSYVPSSTSVVGDKMNFLQRFGNAFGAVAGAYSIQNIQKAELEVVNKHFNINLVYEDIIGDLVYIFTNSNPYLNYPKPILAKNIQIGGITVSTKAKKLEKKWDDVLNLRKQTVYVSFGSMAKSKDMPLPYRDSLISVMESMPDVTFIWKYEVETSCVDHLKNVILSPWLPQTDLLADSRLFLFITHGGLGSITEVAYVGRPTIMIPLFAEQPRNAAMLARHGGGILLTKDDLASYEKIRTSIKNILEDDSYAQNASALAKMLNSPPVEPKKLFVSHMEFAAKFGKLPQMDPEGRKQSIVQYYLLDVFALVLVVLTLISLGFIYFVKRVFNKFFSIRKEKNE